MWQLAVYRLSCKHSPASICFFFWTWASNNLELNTDSYSFLCIYYMHLKALILSRIPRRLSKYFVFVYSKLHTTWAIPTHLIAGSLDCPIPTIDHHFGLTHWGNQAGDPYWFFLICRIMFVQDALHRNTHMFQLACRVLKLHRRQVYATTALRSMVTGV